MNTAVLLISSMRPHQWVKNTLIFAPLLFARRALDPAALASVSLVFLLFCLLSGGIYLINDVVDRRLDAGHPEKKKRPVASGRLSPSSASAAGAVLCLSSTAASALISTSVAYVFAGYALISLSYIFFFKNVVILDAMAVASGFLLRVAAGGLAIPVEISFWLLICTALIALFLSLGKRRHELHLLEGEAPSHRPVLKEYSPYLLDQMISLVATSTVIAYALYCISPAVRAKLGTSWMGLTTPFVLYGVLRYLYLIHRRDKGGDPTQAILRDGPLAAAILLWSLTVVVILYLRQ
jgi:4-hydroxybenzoate polyprenyltransferase